MLASKRGRRVATRIDGPSSAVALAADALRDRILNGRLPQGGHISEQALADELGVGRATLREALRDLGHDGLVTHLPGVGTRVVVLTLQDAYEIVSLREHLEDLAIDLGVPAPDHRVNALFAAVERLEESAAAGDEDRAVPDSLAFHRAFIELAGHARLASAFRTIHLPLGLLMQLNRRAQASEETLAERAARHRRLADLVQEGDPAVVRAELRAHRTTQFLAEALPDDGASEAALAWAATTRMLTKATAPTAPGA